MRTFLKRAWFVTAVAVWIGGGFVSNVEAGPPFKTGDLDPSFGDNGVATMIDFGTPYYFANDMALQPDDKIVVVGTAEDHMSGTTSYVPTKSYFTITRYNANGSLDSSFGPNGFAITSFSTKHIDRPSAVAIQPDGKILVVGSSHTMSPYYSDDKPRLVLARYTTTGALDISFDGKGFVLTMPNKPAIFGKGYCSEYPEYEKSCLEQIIPLVGISIALQTDGKIVVGGRTDLDYSNRSFLVRFNPDGSLDSSFGEEKSGFVSLPYDEGGIASIAFQQDGRVLAATAGGDLARLHSDGALDISFNNFGNLADKKLGIVDLPFDKITHILPKSDGSIVVAGGSCLAVLNENGSLNTTVGNDKGYVCLPSGSLKPKPTKILAFQEDAKFLATEKDLGGDYVGKIYLKRFNLDGSEDPSFGTVNLFGYGYADDWLIDMTKQQDADTKKTIILQNGKIVLMTNFVSYYYHFPQDALLTRHFNDVTCGNGIKELTETCDDGPQNGQPNNCNESCSGYTASICGNGILEAGEECDNGAANNNIIPSACPTNCRYPVTMAERLTPPKTGVKPSIPRWLLKQMPKPQPMPN